MGELRVLDLFSGIGGFSLGLERTGGFKTIGFCEIDPFCRHVLAKHWPEVPCHDDITTMQFQEGMADVVTGGFPCQDISLAGRGAGLAGKRSGLWRELVRAIRLVRPRYAIVENVAALLSRGMGRVLGDLAEIGNDAEWHCVPARAVGAEHWRDRTWIVAYPEGRGRNRRWGAGEGSPLLELDRLVQEHDWPWADARECSGPAYGVPGRLDGIRAFGNAASPANTNLIGRAILKAENRL